MAHIPDNNSDDEKQLRGHRGKYVVVSPAVKLVIAKQAAVAGIHAAIANNKGLGLKYMTVKLWRDKYLKAKREQGMFAINYTYFALLCTCPLIHKSPVIIAYM